MNTNISFKNELLQQWIPYGFREKIINGIYILYNKNDIKQLTIIDSDLQGDLISISIKTLIPFIVNKYWDKDKEMYEIIYSFINQLKKSEMFKPIILKTVLTYGSGFTHLQPNIFPLFVKKIINYQDLEQEISMNNKNFSFKTRKFSNDFLMELINSPLYTLDNILDNIDLFEIDYAATFLKFKDIHPYIHSIEWTPEKMNRQKLLFNDVISNIECFSHDCINRYVITHCTIQEKETLLLIKEMI